MLAPRNSVIDPAAPAGAVPYIRMLLDGDPIENVADEAVRDDWEESFLMDVGFWVDSSRADAIGMCETEPIEDVWRAEVRPLLEEQMEKIEREYREETQALEQWYNRNR